MLWLKGTGLRSIGVFRIQLHSLNTLSWLEPAIQAVGGRFLTRGSAVAAFEAGIKERSIVIEFDSPAEAIEAYGSPTYQSAKKLLEGAVERDVRILEGVS